MNSRYARPDRGSFAGPAATEGELPAGAGYTVDQVTGGTGQLPRPCRPPWEPLPVHGLRKQIPRKRRHRYDAVPGADPPGQI